MRGIIIIICLALAPARAAPAANVGISADYFAHKHVPYLCYLACESRSYNQNLVKAIMKNGVRVSIKLIDDDGCGDLNKALIQRNVAVGVLLDGSCKNVEATLKMASQLSLFDGMHVWLILTDYVDYNTDVDIDGILQQMNLSIDADIAIASNEGGRYDIIEVFNFGKIQGNNLERNIVGKWSPDIGLDISSARFKYYDRWDFHNLTLRAISVILERPKVFKPEMLSDVGFTAGVSVMTKIVTQLLDILKEKHNFRFNYTIAGRWIGSPKRNSTLAVTNSLYWGEQDISCTCARIFTQWLDWVDVFFPPATRLETKFYYVILDKGVGDYENRFLTPLSSGVWWCTAAASLACVLLLGAAAVLEGRDEPRSFAFFSVFAVICQQAFEDGIIIFEEAFSSQGRRLVLMIVGITSMLLYNYYTSSVVSWLLNAAAPTLADLDALITSDLELVFEDIGYTRGWLDNPGFFYFTGFTNPKEDVLREKKVTKAKRKATLLQPAAQGIELIRSGEYAYHTEPYTAYQAISKTFEDIELCELGSLQMMTPAYVYIMAQRRSPYKQFFVWSLMRLLERGHMSAARARVSGYTPTCSGRTPRALALGQAAPAFAVLAQAAVLSLLIMFVEILWRRFEDKKKNRRALNNHGNDEQEPAQLGIIPREHKKQ